ncbi:MAG: hypothetical protein COY40_02175 [Alphaproteobacteria bacterium CG_4_10_14_0_8_um_filter_53_9]|nr:MAG: hypothetical protein COY40_02175 [Alphaproteobacteria bacterium CG_4_10_14_0_8_um_filter_53_9]
MNQRDQWQTWMQAAQQGDQLAYAKLLKDVCPYLRNYLRPRLSQQDMVEDVVQEVLLAIHTARHTWNPEEPLMPWLHGIIRYKLADGLRSIYRKNQNEVVDTDMLVTLSVAVPNKDAEGTNMDMDTMLATLTPRQRDIVRMTKLEGHTAEETGQKLGMSSSAVKVALHRILQTLKDQFGPRT